MKEPIIDEHFFFKGNTLNYFQTWDYINCKDTPRNLISSIITSAKRYVLKVDS